jgi:hypothetical protein
MKKIGLLLFVLFIINACNKQTNTPSQTPAPAPVNHNGILKSARIQVYKPSGNLMYCVLLDYIYNSQNQHFQTTQKDSGMTGNTWSQAMVFVTNHYNSFNKHSKIEYSTPYTLEYFYDQNQKIQFEVSTDMMGEKDTTFYTHQQNLVFGNRKDHYGTSLSYYSQNLDSLVNLDTNQNRISKTHFSHNNTPDLSQQAFNQHQPLISNHHELTSSTMYAYTQNPPLVETRTYTRTYDHMGYSISRTMFVQGVKRELVYFTYQ